jgi:osmotically-inducible protein OsmY
MATGVQSIGAWAQRVLKTSKETTTLRIHRILVPLLFAAIGLVGNAQTQPDNTKVNQRDRNSAEPTADQQKMNSTDQKLAASIRKSILDDKSLSTYAHNIKIISQDGTVTLKGPVRSEEERKSIVSKATEVAGGAGKINDELSVKP